jgi:hypothetical protein
MRMILQLRERQNSKKRIVPSSYCDGVSSGWIPPAIVRDARRR